ncbi:zinc finger protein 117-like [Battus philenor]|uniref:zinc finger protein 117-like n=1 Tax=Battus philenor TaxID=42288 RepID=UPI0035CEB941
MDEVKFELSKFERICSGCLSLDRNVLPLGDLSELFYKLCRIQCSEYTTIQLCWECQSILRKTWRFQRQIQHAQHLLQQTDSQLKNMKAYNLSTLGTILNENIITIYDNTCEETDQKIHLKIEQDIDKTDYDALDDTLNDSIYSEEETKNYLKKEVDTGSNVLSNKNEQFYKRCYKYKKQALIKTNVFNCDNLNEYYIKTALNDKVMEEVVNRQMTRNKKDYLCKVCGVGFQKNIDLKRHRNIRHPPPKGPYKCSECQNSGTLSTLNDLQAHWRTHFVLKCKLCPEVCRTVAEVNRHLLQVHQHQYQCIECGQNFNAFRVFFRHYKELHEKMICDHCGKSFGKKKTLETHIKRKHLPPICDTCGRSYKSIHALESHSRLSHPELHYDLSKTELSYCVECNKQFNSVYTYRRHLSTAYIHRPPKPVNIPCPDCGKVFSRKIYMNNHYKLFHVKKSRHYCELCSKYYVTAYALRNHRLRVHEKTYPPKDKICDICGRGFSTNRVLIHHRRTHTGEKPYKCSQCPAAFAQLCAKKSHERSQHKMIG